MKNVKDEVYSALKQVTENVTDTYQLIEDENKVNERVGNVEATSYIRHVIDIWHNKNTSDTAMAVDKKVSALGLVRTSCKDVPDPSGLKHKHMVYEGIIDMNSDVVYWNN